MASLELHSFGKKPARARKSLPVWVSPAKKRKSLFSKLKENGFAKFEIDKSIQERTIFTCPAILF
jgi:hypothetical protein